MPTNRGYQTDPALARAAANIAGLFAPPSGADAQGWANATAIREKNARLAELYNSAADPNFNREVFDRRGIAVGNYTPVQSLYAQDQNDATARRGQDMTSATSRDNNIRDNARQFAQTRYGVINEGQILPALPGSVASLYGMPESPIVQGNLRLRPGEDVMRPDGSIAGGRAVDLTRDQVLGAAMRSLPLEQQQMAALGGQGLQQIVGPDGKPQFVPNAQAVGRPAYNAPTGREVNGQAMRDGVLVPTRQNDTGQWVYAQDNTPVPGGVQVTNMATPTGSNEQIGASTRNQIDQRLIDLDAAKDTAVRLRSIIASAPAAQGLLGSLRGTVQNAVQMGGEVGQFFGGNMQNIQSRIRNGLEDASLGGAFDPNIPAVEMLGNLLAYQYAKASGADRLSNEQLRNARTALGLDGLGANQASSITRLNEAIQAIERETARNRGVRGAGGPTLPELPAPRAPSATTPGMQGVAPSNSAVPPPAAPAAGAPRRLRYNPQTGALE